MLLIKTQKYKMCKMIKIAQVKQVVHQVTAAELSTSRKMENLPKAKKSAITTKKRKMKKQHKINR